MSHSFLYALGCIIANKYDMLFLFYCRLLSDTTVDAIVNSTSHAAEAIKSVVRIMDAAIEKKVEAAATAAQNL